jgi:hypothetical protein
MNAFASQGKRAEEGTVSENSGALDNFYDVYCCVASLRFETARFGAQRLN